MPQTRAKSTTRAKTAARPAASGKGDARPKTAKAGTGLSAKAKLAELRQRLLEVSDLNNAGAVLGWDQATYMPKGGAAARARQGATLSRLAHEKFTDPALGKLLDGLATYDESLPYDSDDASLIRVVAARLREGDQGAGRFRRALERASARPPTMPGRGRGRPTILPTMRPLLEKALDFSRQYADFFAPYAHIADPLIDGPDEGMTAATRARAVRRAARGAGADRARHRRAAARRRLPACAATFPEAAAARVRPRPSSSASATTSIAAASTRRTIRSAPSSPPATCASPRACAENDLGEALFSTLHEAGHALYEQGVDAALRGHAARLAAPPPACTRASRGCGRTWSAAAAGSGSTSIRSCATPSPTSSRSVPLETFYRAINKVERSLIRTDADEVTYNLHVMLRFDLELDLLEGRLAVKDLPEAWRARFKADFGIDAARRSRRLPAGRALVRRQRRRRLPGLHHRQHPERPVLRRRPQGPSRDPAARSRKGEFGTLHAWLRDSALPARPQVHAPTSSSSGPPASP